MKKGSSRHPPNEMQLSCSVSPIPDCKDTTNLLPASTKKVYFDETPYFFDEILTSIDKIVFHSLPLPIYIYV